MTDTTDYELNHLKQLVGWTVSHIVSVDGNEDTYSPEPTYALILRKPGTKHQFFCRIQCDPEGNGPGFLTIEKERIPK